MLKFIKSLFKREPVVKSDHYRFSPVGEPLTFKYRCLRCEISWWADKIGDKICPSCSDDRYVYLETPDNRPVYWRKEFCANCGYEFEYESPTFCSCPGCGNDYDIHTIEYKRIK